MSEPESVTEPKKLCDLTFEELKLDDPRYIEWVEKFGIPKYEMKSEEVVIALNLLLWQYQTMLETFSTRRLITQCLLDNHMTPYMDIGIPNVYAYKGKHILMNFDANKGDVMAFKPTFTEVP